MTEFRGRVGRVTRDCGGLIDKFMGDAAMILFEPGPDPAQTARNCLECAEALSREIARWSAMRVGAGEPPLSVGIGAHWGPVLAALVGEDDRLEYTVFGDTVNIAARLEEMTRKAGCDILVSQDLLTRAGVTSAERSGWTALGAATVRGRAGVVELWGRGGAGVRPASVVL